MIENKNKAEAENILFKSFKILLGKGRAFNLQENNISNISKSFLKPFEELLRIFNKIARTPFVADNQYNNESELSSDIINFEKQFNITNSNKASNDERSKNIEVQYGLVGGQSWMYLENLINNAGIDARILENEVSEMQAACEARHLQSQACRLTEGSLERSEKQNIPEKDIISNNIIQYGYNQFNGEFIMYGRNGFIIVDNGTLQMKAKNKETNKLEIVNQDPVSILNNQYTNLFLIESKKGGVLNITTS